MAELPDQQGHDMLLRIEIQLAAIWFRLDRASIAAVESGDEIAASELRRDAKDFLKAWNWISQLRHTGRISVLLRRPDGHQLKLLEGR